MRLTVSVIIPAYNRAALLCRALDSVLSQSLPATEIIVIDDGSTDHTATLIKTHYPQVRYFYQDNQGVSAARNLGIRHARTDWLALLDSDDEWLPDKLEKQLAALNAGPDYRLIHSDEIWIRHNKRINQMRKHEKAGGYIFRRCLPLCAISPSAAIIHRTVFDELGLFDTDLPACEDYDFWLRFCARYPVLYIDEPLIKKYGGHEDQLSRRHYAMDRFRLQALDKILKTQVLNEADYSAALATLTEKATILMNGAHRHNNQTLYRFARDLLASHQPFAVKVN